MKLKATEKCTLVNESQCVRVSWERMFAKKKKEFGDEEAFRQMETHVLIWSLVSKAQNLWRSRDMAQRIRETAINSSLSERSQKHC